MTTDSGNPGCEGSGHPFGGLRIVDLSDRLAAAFAGRLFGDFGADVVLCEPPAGHPLRREAPILKGPETTEHSALHAFINWNKRSECRDEATLARLLADADVLITDCHPLGKAPFSAALRFLRADAVHLSVTPYGLDSPLTGTPGNNLTASAKAGWSSINGYRDEPPLQLPGNQAGYIAGLAGFLAAAAALRRRHACNSAELVDVSELEALALTVHPWGIARVYERGGTPTPDGRTPRGRPGPLYEAADGQLSLAVAYFRQWPKAMAALGVPEFADRDDLLDDNVRHTKDISDVNGAIIEALRSMDRWTVFHALATLRCPAGVLQDVASLLDDPQLQARGYYVQTVVGGKRVRAPGRLARTRPPVWQMSAPAPELSRRTTESALGARPVAAEIPTRTPTGQGECVGDGGPLAGVRVLSFGQAWSGAFGTELLALLGADVVQVSSLRRHDSWRRAGAGVPNAIADPGRHQHPMNTQGLFNSVNLNKREIALDLTHQRGKDLLWRLIPRFSVLVDNYRPGVMSSWGMTLERLAALCPGMVWASVSGYGSDGPYAAYPAIGTTIEPMAGIASLNGYQGDAGMNTSGLYPDPVAAYALAACIVAALHERDRSGAAQRIDLSMMEAVALMAGEWIISSSGGGSVPGPLGNHHPRVAPHNNYAALDGDWIALSADDDAAWEALVRYIGDDRLHAPEFATVAGRKEHEEALDAILADWCCQQPAEKTEKALGPLGVCVARVIPLPEIYSRPDPQLSASGFLTRVDHPEVGPSWLPGAPWRLSRSRPDIRPAPCVGQHSREILAAELGITDAEYQALVADGITGALTGDAAEA